MIPMIENLVNSQCYHLRHNNGWVVFENLEWCLSDQRKDCSVLEGVHRINQWSK